MTKSNVLALDIGEKRIGVASGDTVMRIPVARGFVEVDGNEIDAIGRYVNDLDIDRIVVGYPRNMSGQTTAQTTIVELFVEKIRAAIGLPVDYQDESLTSVAAEETLKQLKKPYSRGDIDAEAARLILRDFLEEYANRPQ